MFGIRERKEERKRRETYIQERITKINKEIYETKRVEKEIKQYFFDSEIYSKIFDS